MSIDYAFGERYLIREVLAMPPYRHRMLTIGVSLPPDVVLALEAEAIRSRVARARVARDAIVTYLGPADAPEPSEPPPPARPA